MPLSARTDPWTCNNFRVEIDGLPTADFLSVTGLEAAVAIVDYRNGNDKLSAPRKVPGEAGFTNIILKRGLSSDLNLWNWMRQTLEGQVSRRNVAIVMLNDAGQDVLRFIVPNAWPAKWTGPTLNGESGDVAIETLELAHEGLTVTT